MYYYRNKPELWAIASVMYNLKGVYVLLIIVLFTSGSC